MGVCFIARIGHLVGHLSVREYFDPERIQTYIGRSAVCSVFMHVNTRYERYRLPNGNGKRIEHGCFSFEVALRSSSA